jgi:hypothetical protein
MSEEMNIQHSTFNIERSRPAHARALFQWTLSVECWLLNVPFVLPA